MILIPYQQLQSPTLNALMEEFVTRDGAVHGHVEMSLSAKIDAVRSQLRCGKAVIVFDETNDTCTIVLKEDLKA